ncbi:MAG TPA: hypothetical protein VEK38_00120 [Candidatus Bathyarchaeia archaeon]|nr:hypothetical protein [Candidatus Bathyarchaeia archaeon]
MITKRSFCTYALAFFAIAQTTHSSQAAQTAPDTNLLVRFFNYVLVNPTELTPTVRAKHVLIGGFLYGSWIRVITRSTKESFYTASLKQYFTSMWNHLKKGQVALSAQDVIDLLDCYWLGNEFKLVEYEQEFPDGLLIKDKKVKAKPCGIIGNFDAYILKNLPKSSEYSLFLAGIAYTVYNYIRYGKLKTPEEIEKGMETAILTNALTKQS